PDFAGWTGSPSKYPCRVLLSCICRSMRRFLSLGLGRCRGMGVPLFEGGLPYAGQGGQGKADDKEQQSADDVSRRIGAAGVDAGDKIIRHRDEIGAADDVQAGSVLD